MGCTARWKQTKEAQIGKMGRWRREGKDFAKVGVVKGSGTVVWSPRQFLLWFVLIFPGL